MYAYVIFEEDNVSAIVSINDIKFKSSSYETYNPGKTYKVKYSDGRFYKAFIIAIAETTEEVKRKAEQKRIRLPAAKVREMSVTNDEISSSDNENIPPNTVRMERNVARKKKNTQEKAFQVENFSKIMMSVNEQMDLPNTEDCERENWREKCDALQKENRRLEDENRRLTQLNFDLQHEVIAKFKSIDFMENLISPAVTADSNKTPKTIPDYIPVGGLYDGQIHIGRGEWLPVAIYNMCMAKKKDSIFVKEIASSVFSPEVLSKSSVTGQPGNKTSNSAKPALDATKLLAIEDILQFRMLERGDTPDVKTIRNSVHKYIRDKIQDLIRPPRDSRSKKTSSRGTNPNMLPSQILPAEEEHVEDANIETSASNLTFNNENTVVIVDEVGVEIGRL